MKRLSSRCALVAALVFVLAGVAIAQMSPEEHASHHGGQAQQQTASPSNPGTPMGPPAGAGPSMGGMGEMMKQMGTSPPKELYPSLMSLPNLPPEKRAEVERQAHERMTSGTSLLSDALAKLASSTERQDYAAMQDASEQMREGLAQFESGLAAHRALAEGMAPRNVALEWFKSEMSLQSGAATVTQSGPLGLSWFHAFAMFILITFTSVMIWMYFHKMQRAESLLASLAATGQRETSFPAVLPAFTPVSPAPPQAASPSGTATVVPAALAAYTTPAGRWSGQLRISKIFQETADVKTFRLVHPSAGDLPFTFEPGQFLTVSVNINGKEAKRSYSIASSACRRTWCELTVKHAAQGAVSGYLHEHVKANDLLAVTGPFGKFTFRGHEAPSVVLLAGGVGITPLMSAIRCLTDQAWTGEIFLIYACPTLQDIIFREELDYLVRRYANLSVTIVLSKETSSAWRGERGHISKELLLKTVPNLTGRRVHICGPPPMMDAMRSILAEIGVPPDQVKTENFLGAEPRPSPPGGMPQITVPGQAARIAVCTFARSGKSAPMPPDETVLEASEDVGVNIEYSCRQGYCGVCKTKLLSGRVTMAVEDALTPEDKAANIILACQAKSQENIEVDA